jgi:hypothetical protein
MKYVLEIGCVDRLSLVSPPDRVLSEIAELGSGPIRAEFIERPDCRHRRSVEFGVATRVTERTIVDELTDDVVIFFDKAHVVVSAPDDVNKNIWMLDAESAVPWKETVLDAIAAMEGVAFVIHASILRRKVASGDTIVSGDIENTPATAVLCRCLIRCGYRTFSASDALHQGNNGRFTCVTSKSHSSLLLRRLSPRWLSPGTTQRLAISFVAMTARFSSSPKPKWGAEMLAKAWFACARAAAGVSHAPGPKWVTCRVIGSRGGEG